MSGLLESLFFELQKQVREIENDKVALESDFSAMRERVEYLKTEIAKLDKEKDDQVAAFQNRIHELEMQIERFTGRVEGAQTGTKVELDQSTTVSGGQNNIGKTEIKGNQSQHDEKKE